MPITAAAYNPRGRPKTGSTEVLVIPGVALVSGLGTLAPGANLLYYFPIQVEAALRVTGLLCEITTLQAGQNIRVGLYNCDENLQPTSLIVDGGNLSTGATGVVEAAVDVTLQPGRYLIAFNCSHGTPAVRFARGGTNLMGYVSGLGSNLMRSELTIASAFGALASTGVAWTSTGGFSSPPPYFVFLRASYG